MNSKSIYIECSLKDAEIKNQNTYTNVIRGGVVLEAGDTIQVDNVAVNSIGINQDSIEIPLINEDPNHHLQTNKIRFNVGKYITTGSRFCCPLPFLDYAINSGTNLINYGYAREPIRNDVAHFSVAPSVIPNNTYNYLAQGNLPTGIALRTGSSTTINNFASSFNTYKDTKFSQHNYRGVLDHNLEGGYGVKLHLVGNDYFDNLPDKINVFKSKPPYLWTDKGDSWSVISYPHETEIDIGYDTADNIARKITNQFHYYKKNNGNEKNPVDIFESSNVGTNPPPPQTAIEQPAVKNAWTTTEVANGVYLGAFSDDGLTPNLNPTNATPEARPFNPLYYRFYTQNPYRMIWGSILNAPYIELYTKKDFANADNVIIQPVIYDNVGVIEKYFVTTTNFMASAYVDVGNFMRENQVYLDWKTKPELVDNSTEYGISLDLGRYNDTNLPDNSSANSLSWLDPSWLDVAGNGLHTSLYYYSKWDQEIYDQKQLTPTSKLQGYHFIEEYNGDKWADLMKASNLMIALVGNVKDSDFKCLAFIYTGLDETLKEVSYPDITAYGYGYIGFDFTWTRNQSAIAINLAPNTQTASTSVNTTPTSTATPKALDPSSTIFRKYRDYPSFIQLGSPNVALSYNRNNDRMFDFSYLHFPAFVINDNVSAEVVKILPKMSSANTGNATDDPQLFNIPMPIGETTKITTYFDKQGGSTILSLTAYEEGSDNRPVEVNKDNFGATLLGRLGFVYADLFAEYGLAYNEYSSIAQKNFKEYPYQACKPITTNANYQSSMAYAFGTQIYSNSTTNSVNNTSVGGTGIAPQPYQIGNSYDLNFNNNIATNINTTSVIIKATTLPKRLAYPYWIIQSNIIPSSNYVGRNGNKNNIVAVLNRAYLSGDYAYGMGGDMIFKVENPATITEITTGIFNNDFSSLLLGDGCCVIYKITKNFKKENEMLQIIAQKEQQQATKKA